MSYLRLVAIGAASLLTVTACNKTEDAVEIAVEQTSNTLFDYVPVNTPYLAGNLEPIPDEVIDVFLQRFQPALDSMQFELAKARQALEEGSTQHPGDGGTRLIQAILQELDGKLSRQGMESLGFDLQSNKVVYGVGAFPVVRIGLSDADELRATIQRVLANSGLTAPELDHKGVSYWRLGDDDTGGEFAGLFISILEDHLALSILPKIAEAELLPAFLGLEMPEDSNAAARLAELNAEHDYSPYASGILDLDTLFEEFINPDSAFARLMAASGEFDPADMTPECTSEIRGLVSNSPRMTVGTRELTPAAIAMQYRVETKPSLAQQLTGLVARIPMADPLSKRILEFSFGMRFGAARDFLREKAAAIMETPYLCNHLQSINKSAAETFTQLNQPMPPLVNNFRGLRLSLNEIAMSQSTPVNGRGLVAVYVEQPEMFVGMAQMFLPDLTELTLIPGEPPVQLPASLVPVPDTVAFAALTSDAIGLSAGEGEEDSLPGYLAEKAGPDGMFMSIAYDMVSYLEYTQDFENQFKQAPGDNSEIDPEKQAALQSLQDISGAAQEAYKSFADRSYTTFSLTPEGVVADSRMTFK
jgi:hypothetical protein